MTYRFFQTCVDWPRGDVYAEGGLCDMIDQATDITRRTFISKVDKIEIQKLERYLGYVRHRRQGMTMAADWHVSYHRSKLHGKRVYFLKHSTIEYVFRSQNERPNANYLQR